MGKIKSSDSDMSEIPIQTSEQTSWTPGYISLEFRRDGETKDAVLRAISIYKPQALVGSPGECISLEKDQRLNAEPPTIRKENVENPAKGT